MLGRTLRLLALTSVLGAGCGGPFSTAPSTAGADASAAESVGDGDASTGDAAVCTPRSCPDLQWSCGTGDDGCGGAIDCGRCHVTDFTCQDHRCACTPKSCAALGYACGSGPDGCEGVIDCGACPAGQTCGGGGDHRCGTSTCVAKTCASAGAECGIVSDGCGGQIDCGACAAPSTCGGSGTPNRCDCVPKTCAQLGWQCGSGDDGCGGTIVCPSCVNGTCDAKHQCGQCASTITCKSKGYTCGTLTNDCGNEERCGPKPQRDSSQDAKCLGVSGHPAFYTCPNCRSDGGSAPVCTATGPTPPMPGWDCVGANVLGVLSPGWCCAQ